MRMGKIRMNRELNKELFAGVGKLPTDELQPTVLPEDGLVRRGLSLERPRGARSLPGRVRGRALGSRRVICALMRLDVEPEIRIIA